jgi:hypothetical protein
MMNENDWVFSTFLYHFHSPLATILFQDCSGDYFLDKKVVDMIPKITKQT